MEGQSLWPDHPTRIFVRARVPPSRKFMRFLQAHTLKKFLLIDAAAAVASSVAHRTAAARSPHDRPTGLASD
uniref:Uncharacterized protein n=1 Tax=Globodera rostochiensis TaxID=31243 RepID=A0A914GV32_GLORO